MTDWQVADAPRTETTRSGRASEDTRMRRRIINATQSDRRPAKPAASLPLHPHSKIQRALGTRAGGRFIQAKLTVSQPGDQYEQEADRVAEQVMRMPDPAAPAVVQPVGSPQISRLQRKCSECE